MARPLWLEALVVAGVTVAALAAYDGYRAWRGASDEIAEGLSRREQARKFAIHDAVLTDQDGNKVRFYDDLLRDNIVAITFMYTSCSKNCSLATQNVARAREMIAERTDKPVTFLSITVDPERDGPAELKRFAEAQGLSPSWRLLTGSPEDLKELRRKLGVYDPDPTIDGDASSHSGLVVLGNEPEGRWMMVPALANAVRIRQAVERVVLPPTQWSRVRPS